MSTFRTLEVSNAVYEFEGLTCVTVKSPSLKHRGDLSLFVPPEARGLEEVPLVILLHGVYGSHWNWTLMGGAHRVTQGLLDRALIEPTVLVMPSDGLWGDGSGYLKHADADYEKWIVDDTVQAAIEVENCLSPQSKVFISGLSMGGFGALRLGAKFPERFAGISAHSSITEFSQLKEFVEEPLDRYGTINPNDETVLDWMVENRDRLPPLRFDCGTEDPLLEPNRKLHKALTDSGIEHTYEEFAGGHAWDYWHDHLTDTLRFFHSLLSSSR